MITHTQKIPWEQIQFHNNTINVRKDVIGFDTETLQGYCKLITDSTGKKLLVEEGEYFKLLNFLTHKQYHDTMNVFYNLKFDSAAIIKHLPYENFKEVFETNETTIGDYHIYLLPKKLFKITRKVGGKNRLFTYYDIAQFYDTSLEKAATKYLEIRKESNGLDVKKIGTSLEYWQNNLHKIVKYCVQDSIVCQELGELLYSTIINKLRIKAKDLISAASVSKQYFRANCDFWELDKLPRGALVTAYEGYSGGWFEMFQKGHFKGKIFDSDLNSAYPDAIRNFPNLMTGEWKQVYKYDKDALLGYYSVGVHIPDDMNISPVPIRLKNGIIIHPQGDFITGMTKLEIDNYKNDIDIDVVHGWEYSDTTPTYPFKFEVEKLYRLKEELSLANLKHRFEYSLYKKTLNSFYGNTFQKSPSEPDKGDKKRIKAFKAGLLFNPLMASFITAWCRVKIWNAIKGREDQIINIATDGILSMGDLGLENSTKLGEWEVNQGHELTMFQPGIYQLDTTVKTRGMERSKSIFTPEGVEYEHIYDYIKNEPDRLEYSFCLDRVLGAYEVLTRDRYSQKDCNIFVEKIITKDINSDEKRVWSKKFKNGGELLNTVATSIPLNINELYL